MNEIEYFDKMGKPINVDDRIHYSNKDGINIAWVKELMPNNDGIRIMGKGNKRDCVIKQSNKKVIVTVKGYYKDRKKSKERNKV